MHLSIQKLISYCFFLSAIGNAIAKRLTSFDQWASEGASNAHEGGALKRQSTAKEAPAQKNKARRSSRPHGDDLVSIQKSGKSPYPERSKARVTFKDDLQYSAQKTPVAKSARTSASAPLSKLPSQVDDKVLDAESSQLAIAKPRPGSRDYKCSVCGQPKKGHICRGGPSSAVVQTPMRSQSESQATLPTRSPKFITPTPDSARNRKPTRRKRKNSCGECENCQREDCGKCSSCKDKVKFGGAGKKKQKCEEKRCLSKETLLLPAQSRNTDKSQLTTPSTRTSTKRKSAVAANLAIMNVMADEDLENKAPSDDWSIGKTEDVADAQLLVKRAKIAPVEEKLPSFEEISASDFTDLIDLLQSSPLPQRKVDTEVDWQGLYLADLSPIPVLPATRLVRLDTTKPIVLGPNSAWSQQLIMTEEVATPSFHMPKPRTFKSNLRELEPKTSDSQQFESIMSPPNFNRDDYTSIFPKPEDPKLIPYSPIKLLPRTRKSSL